MKSLILIAGIFLTLTAQAADRKLGNVIVIERDIENVYSSCLSNIKSVDTDKPQTFFFCTLQLTKHDGEVLLNKGGGFRHLTDTCQVATEFGAGKMLIYFGGPKDEKTSFEDSKKCLKEATDLNQDLVAILQTVEKTP